MKRFNKFKYKKKEKNQQKTSNRNKSYKNIFNTNNDINYNFSKF